MKKQHPLWCVVIINTDDRDENEIVHVRCRGRATAIRKAVESLDLAIEVEDLAEEPICFQVTEEDIIK